MDKKEHNSFFTDETVKYNHDEATRLGPYSDYTWRHDPKHLFFGMARYKFCAKMLAGGKNLLEVGCGEAFTAPMMLQTVETLTGLDVVPEIIGYNNAYNTCGGRARFLNHNIIESPMEKKFDSCVSMDVIEHIDASLEDRFIGNIAASLLPHSPCVIGTPNITSDRYAGESSRREHINLKSHETLKQLLQKHFHNVFLFSMNDEIVHTGFYPMAHYLMALAVAPK